MTSSVSFIIPHSSFSTAFRRRSQVVRQRSAKPLFVGSIPTAAFNRFNNLETMSGVVKAGGVVRNVVTPAFTCSGEVYLPINGPLRFCCVEVMRTWVTRGKALKIAPIRMGDARVTYRRPSRHPTHARAAVEGAPLEDVFERLLTPRHPSFPYSPYLFDEFSTYLKKLNKPEQVMALTSRIEKLKPAAFE